MDDREGRPVLTGLSALVGVALAVGLILGLTALFGARMLGLDGSSDSSDTAAERSMYLPEPSRTTAASGPLITLAPGETQSAPSQTPSRTPSESASPKTGISLSAGQTAVAPMEQIDLSGVYPGGEGAILQVQRFVAGGCRTSRSPPR